MIVKQGNKYVVKAEGGNKNFPKSFEEAYTTAVNTGNLEALKNVCKQYGENIDNEHTLNNTLTVSLVEDMLLAGKTDILLYFYNKQLLAANNTRKLIFDYLHPDLNVKLTLQSLIIAVTEEKDTIWLQLMYTPRIRGKKHEVYTAPLKQTESIDKNKINFEYIFKTKLSALNSLVEYTTRYIRRRSGNYKWEFTE